MTKPIANTRTTDALADLLRATSGTQSVRDDSSQIAQSRRVMKRCFMTGKQCIFFSQIAEHVTKHSPTAGSNLVAQANSLLKKSDSQKY